MGGNALLYAKTERKPVENYNAIMRVVMDKLSDLFPATRLALVKSVHGKDSFGDGDVLLESLNLPTDWIYQVVEAFKPIEIMINRIKGQGISRASPLRFVSYTPAMGDIPDQLRGFDEMPHEAIPCSAISFDYQEFQIDLILTQPEDFQIAQVYYAYNDLGNLMGRIADRMGFKYGWDGLWKNLGEGNDIHDSICVTRDPRAIFEFMGYDYDRFLMGFESLENMFEFAATTPWFQRDLYQFENRNHKDRVRDEKRASYQAFVAWIEHKPWLDKYSWVTYDRGTVSQAREREKKLWFDQAKKRFVPFREEVETIEIMRLEAAEAKKVWNGTVVSEATGLTGRALGSFMSFCRDYKNAQPHFYTRFDAWMAERSPEEVKAFIVEMQRAFQKSPA
jgi:hypothetical protein